MDKTKKTFGLSIVALSVLSCMQSALALEAMSDNDLRVVDGQDGIHAEVSYSSVNVDQVYWEDKAGLSSGSGEQSLRANLNNVSVTRGSVPASENLGVVAEINTGASSSGTPGVDLNLKSRLGKITVADTKFCQSSGCTTADKTLGKLTLESSDQSVFHLTTTNGLFNKYSPATLEFGLKNIDIGLELNQTSAIQQSLLMNDFNFNFTGQGYVYVDDAEGFVLKTGSSGYVDLNRVDSNANGTLDKPGVNLEFLIRNNAGVDNPLIRAGASGRLINAELQMRGVNDDTGAILGLTSGNSIAGSNGIGFRLKADFTNDNDGVSNPTTLELGGAGDYTYGLRFENGTPLVTRAGITTGTETGVALNTEHASIDTGNVYFNLTDATQVTLPENTRLTATHLGSSNNPLATADDFTQTLAPSGVNSSVLSIRGLNFNAVSKRGQFIASDDVTGTYLPSTTSAQWGLGLPIYNMDANFGFYGKTSSGATGGDYTVSKDATTGLISQAAISGSQRIGFSGSISTQGVSTDGSRTTSILLVDGGANSNDGGNPTDYYMGLRNIDMLLNGYGSIGLEKSQLNVSMPEILMVMSAQLAAGYLPGAKYKTCASNGVCYAPSNGFTLSDDVLAGIKVRLGGSINMALIPRANFTDQSQLVDGANKLSFIGVFTLDPTQNNSIQIVDPVDGSTIGLDTLTGRVAFDNAIVVNKDSVGFNLGFNFNPNKQKANVFRVQDLNFYPSVNGTVGSAQRLGEVAITGGRLNANMTVTPRDGAFTF